MFHKGFVLFAIGESAQCGAIDPIPLRLFFLAAERPFWLCVLHSWLVSHLFALASRSRFARLLSLRLPQPGSRRCLSRLIRSQQRFFGERYRGTAYRWKRFLARPPVTGLPIATQSPAGG